MTMSIKQRFGLLPAMALMALTACINDTVGEATLAEGELRLSASMGGDDLRTRSVADGDNSYFSATSYLAAFIEENGGTTSAYAQPVRVKPSTFHETTFIQDMTFVADNADTERKQFWPTSGNGLNIYAWHPWRLSTDADYLGTSLDGATADEPRVFSVGTDQSATITTSDLMFGLPSVGSVRANPVQRTPGTTLTQVPLQFEHLLSKLKVVLSPGVGDISEDLLKGAQVTIDGVQTSVNITSLRTGTYTANATLTANIVLKALGAGSLSCYAVLPPQSIAGKTLTVTLTNGGQFKYTFPTEGDGIYTSFERGKVYTYNVSVDLTELVVTSTIADWLPTTPQDGNAAHQ